MKAPAPFIFLNRDHKKGIIRLYEAIYSIISDYAMGIGLHIKK